MYIIEAKCYATSSDSYIGTAGRMTADARLARKFSHAADAYCWLKSHPIWETYCIGPEVVEWEPPVPVVVTPAEQRAIFEAVRPR